MNQRGVRAQLENAQSKLAELHADWVRICGERLYEVALVPVQGYQKQLVVFTVFTTVPDSFGIKVGEFTGSLRAVLDYFTWRSYVEDGGDENAGAAKNIGFPIVEDMSKWDGIQKGKLKHAPAEAVRVIKSLQPAFRDGPRKNNLLRLQSLSNPVKHRDIHLAAGLTIGHEPTFSLPSDLRPGQAFSFLFDMNGLIPLEAGQYRVATAGIVEDYGRTLPLNYARGDFKPASSVDIRVSLGLVAADRKFIDIQVLPSLLEDVEDLAAALS